MEGSGRKGNQKGSKRDVEEKGSRRGVNGIRGEGNKKGEWREVEGKRRGEEEGEGAAEHNGRRDQIA